MGKAVCLYPVLESTGSFFCSLSFSLTFFPLLITELRENCDGLGSYGIRKYAIIIMTATEMSYIVMAARHEC